MYKTANPVIGSLDEKGEYVLPRPLKKGDAVLIADLNQEATVSGEPDASGNVFVQMGVMKMKIQTERLRLLDKSKQNEQQKKQKQKRGQVSVKAQRKSSMELDIRGYACDDGVHEMEQFIDGAIMANIGTVTIIHGKGTGLLRKAVQQRLKSMKCVKAFRSGTFGEGEEGVTIVTLR